MSQIENTTFSRDLRVSNIHATNATDTQSNFTVNLNRMTETNNIVRVVLKSVSFVNNAYNIYTSGVHQNNEFDWEIQGGASGTVTIPQEGFYTTTNLIDIIAPIIETAAQLVEPAATVTMSSGNFSKKIEMVVTGAAVVVILPASGTLNKVLGNDVSVNVTASPGGTIHVFDSVPNLGGLNNVYVHSTTVGEGNLVDGDVESHDIIGSVPVGGVVPFGSVVHYSSFDDELDSINYRSFRNFDSINISLRDLDTNIIELNGGEPTEIILKMYYL